MARKAKTTAATKAAKVATKPVDDLEYGRIPATHEEIARQAYHFWEQRGGAGGGAEEDWFRAETATRTHAS